VKGKPSTGKHGGQAAPDDVPNGLALVEIMAIVGLWCCVQNSGLLGLKVGGDGKSLNNL